MQEQRAKGAGAEMGPGEWNLKTALLNASVHGTRLLLQVRVAGVLLYLAVTQRTHLADLISPTSPKINPEH